MKKFLRKIYSIYSYNCGLRIDLNLPDSIPSVVYYSLDGIKYFPSYVDLGLPSKTKWAGNDFNSNDALSGISCSSSSTYLSNNVSSIPTVEQWQELFNNCTRTSLNGSVKYYEYISNINGAAIYFVNRYYWAKNGSTYKQVDLYNKTFSDPSVDCYIRLIK